MASDFGLVYPLWDHSDKTGNLVDRVAGEVGIDHLTVPVVTGEYTQFRLGGSGESPYFHTEGGWHFPPSAKTYAAGSVRPRAARWFGARDVLADVRACAERLGLKLVVRVELPEVRSLADHALQIRGRNAWGDDLTSFTPCACGSEFRELLRATLADLVRYEPAGIELQGLRVEPEPLSAGPRGGGLWLSEWPGFRTCFCAACRQIATMANLEADVAARSVRTAAERLANQPPEAVHGRSVLDDDTNFLAYRAARLSNWQAWLDRLAESHGGRRLLFVLEAADLRQPPGWVPRPPHRWPSLLRMDPPMMLNEREEHGLAALRRTGLAGLALPVWVPGGPGPDHLVQLVSRAATARVEFFDFESLEEAPAGAVTWLKQAVRYARRG